MKQLTINFLLFLISIFLVIFFGTIGFIYALYEHLSKEGKLSNFSIFLLDVAKSIDQSGNVICQYLFNDLLILDYSEYRFGNEDEKISYVLGINKQQKTLTKTGAILSAILNLIDKNHVEKAVERNKPSY